MTNKTKFSIYFIWARLSKILFYSYIKNCEGYLVRHVHFLHTFKKYLEGLQNFEKSSKIAPCD